MGGRELNERKWKKPPRKSAEKAKKKKFGMFQFRSRIFLRAERLFWESSSLLLTFVVLEGARPPLTRCWHSKKTQKRQEMIC